MSEFSKLDIAIATSFSLRMNSKAPCSKTRKHNIHISLPNQPSPLEHPTPNPIKHQTTHHQYPRKFQHSNLIPLTRHRAQPPRTAFDAGRHGGEGLGGGVEDALVARIVVDVDGHGS